MRDLPGVPAARGAPDPPGLPATAGGAAPADGMSVLVEVARRLRRSGAAASPDRVHAWARAAAQLDPTSAADLYRSGRVTMCSRHEELELFDEAFAACLLPGPEAAPEDQTVVTREHARAALFDDGQDSGTEESDEEIEVPLASSVERLAERDLGELPAIEPEVVRLLAAAFSRPGESRRTRRSAAATRGRADRARTLRRIIAGGGEMAEIAYRAPRRHPRRLVLLVDVSGSMATYGEALLYFAHAACRRRDPRTEVFTVGTRLTRVTTLLQGADPARAVGEAMAAATDRGGGTRLGDLVKEFLDRWGQRGVARGAVVVVMSDGWERGDPEELGRQMARLARLARRVVWANPRKAQPGYEPLAAGMAASLPYVDEFVEGHSLAALVRLADAVLGTAPSRARREPAWQPGPPRQAGEQRGGTYARAG